MFESELLHFTKQSWRLPRHRAAMCKQTTAWWFFARIASDDTIQAIIDSITHHRQIQPQTFQISWPLQPVGNLIGKLIKIPMLLCLQVIQVFYWLCQK